MRKEFRIPFLITFGALLILLFCDFTIKEPKALPGFPAFGDSIAETATRLVDNGFILKEEYPDQYWFEKDGVEYGLYEENGLQTIIEYRTPATKHWNKLEQVWNQVKSDCCDKYEIVSIVEKFKSCSVTGELYCVETGKCDYHGTFNHAGSYRIYISIETTCEVKIKYQKL